MNDSLPSADLEEEFLSSLYSYFGTTKVRYRITGHGSPYISPYYEIVIDMSFPVSQLLSEKSIPAVAYYSAIGGLYEVRHSQDHASASILVGAIYRTRNVTDFMTEFVLVAHKRYDDVFHQELEKTLTD